MNKWDCDEVMHLGATGTSASVSALIAALQRASAGGAFHGKTLVASPSSYGEEIDPQLEYVRATAMALEAVLRRSGHECSEADLIACLGATDVPYIVSEIMYGSNNSNPPHTETWPLHEVRMLATRSLRGTGGAGCVSALLAALRAASGSLPARPAVTEEPGSRWVDPSLAEVDALNGALCAVLRRVAKQCTATDLRACVGLPDVPYLAEFGGSRDWGEDLPPHQPRTLSFVHARRLARAALAATAG